MSNKVQFFLLHSHISSLYSSFYKTYSTMIGVEQGHIPPWHCRSQHIQISTLERSNTPRCNYRPSYPASSNAAAAPTVFIIYLVTLYLSLRPRDLYDGLSSSLGSFVEQFVRGQELSSVKLELF